MEDLKNLSLSRLLDLLINGENATEREKIKEFILENFSESPQHVFEETMKELAGKSDPDLRIVNARLCARNIVIKLLEGMPTMDFPIIKMTCEEQISKNKSLCLR